jgi:hypothetical protein
MIGAANATHGRAIRRCRLRARMEHLMATSNDTPPSSKPPSLLARVGLAFRAFSAVLGDPDTAARFLQAPDRATPAPVAPPAPTTALRQASPDSALQLLSLLQRDARLLDFAGENLAEYSDTQVGAAARLVHEGCAKVLREHFKIVPVRDEAEGSRVALPAGFDAAAVRLTGNVVGQPPFNGSLRHRGWRVAEVRLPQLAEGHDTRVLAAAEVEL